MPDSILELLANALEASALQYVVIGGHAVNAWLEPRFTADIDLTVAADPAALERLSEALESMGWRLETEHGAGLPSGPDFVRFARDEDEPVIELQSAKTEFQEEVIRRAVVSGEGAGLRVATPEDLVVLKLIAFRPKDRVDLIGLVALPGLDWHYVDRWAAVWEVTGRLARMRAASEDPDEAEPE